MARTAGSHSDITGPRVQAAALALFAQHGYAAVSMRQIAREVGVQAGALYNYVPDKQTLLFDLMRTHMQGVLDSYAAVVADGDTPARALERFCRFHIRHHLERPDEVFISYMELRSLSPDNFQVIAGLRGQYETGLCDILNRGLAAGQFQMRDARVTAMAVIAMLTGVTTWFRQDGRLGLDEIEETYWQMVRNTVCAGAPCRISA